MPFRNDFKSEISNLKSSKRRFAVAHCEPGEKLDVFPFGRTATSNVNRRPGEELGGFEREMQASCILVVGLQKFFRRA